ncbi:MAG TPA: hypothetical protein VFZ31_09670 [Vicinamibacterales bacterium]
MSKMIPAFVVLVGLLSGEASAQITQTQRPVETINLSGPRVGVTFLSDTTRTKLLEEKKIDVGFAISQFGWQMEKRFLSSPSGFTGVTEFVALFGGIDQGVVLPSFNWLVGARTASGVEFAAGPNITPAGLAVVVAGGMTFQTGNLNIPVNVAFVPSKNGARVSMLVGFNGRNRP